MKKYIIFFCVIFFLVGCDNSALSQSAKISQNNKPEWLTNPNYIVGKRSAIGCAGIHIKGKNEQKKLAISRAIEQIAMQKKTTVTTQTYRESSSNKLGKSETQSLQSTNNQNISTRVMDEYYDTVNNKLCVLVVEE